MEVPSSFVHIRDARSRIATIQDAKPEEEAKLVPNLIYATSIPGRTAGFQASALDFIAND